MRNGKLYVEDLSSANGTFVNYQKLEALCETPLKAGDCVAFGCKTKTAPYSPDDMPIRFGITVLLDDMHTHNILFTGENFVVVLDCKS